MKFKNSESNWGYAILFVKARTMHEKYDFSTKTFAATKLWKNREEKLFNWLWLVGWLVWGFFFFFWHINLCVIYWPSTQPSIKKKVYPVEDIEDITLTCERVEIGAITTPTGSRWVSNNYITRCHRRLELVGVRSWGQLVGVRVANWGSQNQLQREGAAALSDPRLSRPAEWEKCAAIVRGTWGQYVVVCSVSNLPLTHNPSSTLSQPFRE